jgi:hypothetical protein
MTARHWLRRGRLGVVLGLVCWLGVRALAGDDPVVERMRRDITFLASDECEGRGVQTAGIEKAAAYISGEFKKAGLKPGGPGGSYFQPFTMNAPAELTTTPSLRLSGPLGQEIDLKYQKQFSVFGTSVSGKVRAPVVFASYGITAPKIDYDDYKDVDVAGKVVVLLRRTPRFDSEEVPFDGDRAEIHASLQSKVENAVKHKAAAILLVNDQTEAVGDKLTTFGDLARSFGGNTVPFLHLRRAVLDTMLQSSLGVPLSEIEQDIDRTLKPRSAPLAGWTASLEVNVVRKKLAVKNIIGVAEGNGPLANETVVIGAHYDHLGYGGAGSGSLLADTSLKLIHHGADDNASGTTTVIELARRLGAMPNRQGRRIVLMAFSGEESGLLGSQFYCNKEPMFALKDTVAMINLDMVGRLEEKDLAKKNKLLVEGTGTAKNFDKLIETVNGRHKFDLVTKSKGGVGPSDHTSFYLKEVPVFFIWTGVHKDYHRPSDTADKINVPGMRRIAGLVEDLALQLAQNSERPKYQYVAPSHGPGVGTMKIPRLEFMPNYEEDGTGVLIGGVTPGGAAAKAGLKGGDRIVGIAGRPITDMTSYMSVMSRQRRGQAVEIEIVRDGKKLKMTVTPK